MNYLGHLFLAGNDLEYQHDNLYGDFVKGSRLDHLEPKLEQAIRLHRSIDSFIDQHPIVKELSAKLATELPRISKVAIDLYFDHFLAKYWNDYHHEPLTLFLERFYSYPINDNRYQDEYFLHVLFQMKKGRWLSKYDTIDGIGSICEGVSQRISFPNDLKYGKHVLEQNYEEIKTSFTVYMKDAMIHFG